jgi:hypothetical protein
MQARNRTGRPQAALAAAMALIAALMLAVFTTAAQAAPEKGDKGGIAPLGGGTTTPEPTSSPQPGRTPRPIKLRPEIQFGHAHPGGEAHYRQLLFNHLNDPTTVDLGGGSVRGWDVSVDPTETTTLPGYANIISVTVSVPEHPAHWIDIERTHASISGSTPYTTSAFLITITRRHPWSDLQEGHWADDPVQYLADQGVISGYADGSFRPNENVTRAQFAKMLVLGMGWQVQTPSSPTFSDVASDYWAYGYIETAAAHGVITGYGDGTFRPANTVTRAQVAKMIFTARAWTMDSPDYTNFTDVRPGDWSYDYVEAISSAQAMNGYEDHSFRPNAPATRAQIAKILALSLFSDPNN